MLPLCILGGGDAKLVGGGSQDVLETERAIVRREGGQEFFDQDAGPSGVDDVFRSRVAIASRSLRRTSVRK